MNLRPAVFPKDPSYPSSPPQGDIAYDSKRLRFFNERLLDAPSATTFLQSWCIDNGLGDTPIAAIKEGQCEAPDDFILDLLRPRADEAPQCRRVKLVCGPIVLAHADNWFFPRRLPRRDADALDQTDVPFGTLVAPLQPQRRTVRVQFLAELAAITSGAVSHVDRSTPVLEHTAVLIRRDGLTLSAVRESFLGIVLRQDRLAQGVA